MEFAWGAYAILAKSVCMLNRDGPSGKLLFFSTLAVTEGGGLFVPALLHFGRKQRSGGTIFEN